MRANKLSGWKSSSGVVVLLATLMMSSPTRAQLSIGPSGQPSYGYALPVPPARGHQPSLELRYTGGNGGAVGYGWTLSAGSQISRCAANKAIDGVIGSIDFTATDKLCLNGSRLIALDGSGNAVVGRTTRDAEGFGSTTAYKEFRLETDPKVRVRAYGRSGASDDEGPAYFKIWNADGGVLTLGVTPGDSTSLAAVKGTYSRYANTTTSWLLATAVDASGNAVRYFYDTKAYSFGAVVMPHSAGYGFPDSAAPTAGWDTVLKEVQYGGANKIVFSYSDRVRSAWQENLFRGNKTVAVRQLNSVSAYVGASSPTVGDVSGAVAAYTFQLAYTSGAKSSRLLLQSIKRCAGGPASTRCLPETSFTYTPGHDLQYAEEAQFNLGNVGLSGDNQAVIAAADFNGDGRTDLLVRTGQTGAFIYKSDGNGRFSVWSDSALAAAKDPAYWVVRDFNGDGLPDIYVGDALLINLASSFTKYPITALIGGFARMEEYEVGSEQNPDGPYPWYTGASNTIFIDVNGDGKLDAITSAYGGKLPTQQSNVPCTETCTHVYLGDGLGGFTEIPTNISKLLLIQDGLLVTGGAGVIDLNGDGLPDIVHQNPACGLYYESSGEICHGELISRGDGNFDLRGTTAMPKLLSIFGAFGALSSTFEVQGDGQPEIYNSYAHSHFHKVVLAADPSFSTDVFTTLKWGGAPAPLSTGYLSIQALDLNGDGRTDLLELYARVVNNSVQVSDARVYLSDGNGQLNYTSSFNLPPSAFGSFSIGGPSLPQRYYYSKHTALGNFTGKSSQEFLTMADTASGGNKLYTMSAQPPADMLLSVKEGLAGTSTVTYAPAAASNRVSVSRSARAGEIDLAPSGYVAVSLSTPSGVGTSMNVSEYAYAGQKVDRNGRGSLGYAQIKRQVTGPNAKPITSVTTLSQQFPFVGAALKTEAYLAGIDATQGAQLLSRTTQAYCDAASDANARNTAIATETSCPSVSAAFKKPYLVYAKTEARDLDGTVLPTQTALATVNAQGYVNQTVTTLVQGAQQYQSIQNTSYVADDTSCASVTDCRWWIARPDLVSVRKTAPSTIASVSAGTASNATVTQGSLASEPAKPSGAQLQSIINIITSLLLDD